MTQQRQADKRVPTAVPAQVDDEPVDVVALDVPEGAVAELREVLSGVLADLVELQVNEPVLGEVLEPVGGIAVTQVKRPLRTFTGQGGPSLSKGAKWLVGPIDVRVLGTTDGNSANSNDGVGPIRAAPTR